MDRACASCGGPIPAGKRSDAKFCKATCRKRGSRGALVAVTTLPIPPPTGGLSAAVQRELEAAGRLDSALGQAALGLAVRLETGADTGSAVASLTREMRSTLAEAVAGARVAASPLEQMRDELAERRRHRSA